MRTGRSLTVCPGMGCFLPGGRVLPSRGGVCFLLGGVPPSQHALRQTPPPTVNRMTGTSKNITLATTSLRPVKIGCMANWWHMMQALPLSLNELLVQYLVSVNKTLKRMRLKVQHLLSPHEFRYRVGRQVMDLNRLDDRPTRGHFYFSDHHQIRSWKQSEEVSEHLRYLVKATARSLRGALWLVDSQSRDWQFSDR